MEMLYAETDVRQVVVSVDDIPAVCPLLNCGFVYEEDEGPEDPLYPISDPLWDSNDLDGDGNLIIGGTDIPKWGPESDCSEVFDIA